MSTTSALLMLRATASITLLASAAAAGGETITYTYNALGRLVAVEISGGPVAGAEMSLTYDPAGNRCTYTLDDGQGSAPAAVTGCTTSGGSGGGGGGGGSTNQPPVAVDDSGTMTRCAAADFAVLANDSDPDGNLPLALVSVSGGGPRGSPSISGGDVAFTPTGLTGAASVGYVMRDSLGATDSGTLSIYIEDGSCGPQQ